MMGVERWAVGGRRANPIGKIANSPVNLCPSVGIARGT